MKRKSRTQYFLREHPVTHELVSLSIGGYRQRWPGESVHIGAGSRAKLDILVADDDRSGRFLLNST